MIEQSHLKKLTIHHQMTDLPNFFVGDKMHLAIYIFKKIIKLIGNLNFL